MKAVVDGVRKDVRAVWFEDGRTFMIDQRELPARIAVVSFSTHAEVAEAIRNMTTRGAPSIGASAAYAMCLAALNGCDISEAAAEVKAARPTAYDLFHAVDWMVERLDAGRDPVSAADEYAQATVDKCRLIGEHGAKLIEDGMRLMTHCNAGALATVDVGTALAPMRAAHDAGKDFFVYVSETRPRLQGMQLTAWELGQEGIPHRIIPDGASAYYMSQGVDFVITGADRIAANGDFANKIGTFDKAIAAKHFGIPFHVAAPVSTFDLGMADGSGIVIEQRSQDEVNYVAGTRIAPEGSEALNPAFDVTPADLVTGFITEKGILRPGEIGVMRDRHGRGRGEEGAGRDLRQAVRQGPHGLRRGQHERQVRGLRPDNAERQEQGPARAGGPREGRHGRHRGLRAEAVDRDGLPSGSVQREPGDQRRGPLPPPVRGGPHGQREEAQVQPDTRGGAPAGQGRRDTLHNAGHPGARRGRPRQRRVARDDHGPPRHAGTGAHARGGLQQDRGAGVPGQAADALPGRRGPPRRGAREAGGAPMAVLVAKWFGCFLVDERTDRVLDKRLMPRDPQQTAEKLAQMQRGGVLDEERELAEGVEKLCVAERRQSPLGKPVLYDSSHIRASDYGFDDAFMHEAMLGLGKLRTSEPVPRDRNLVQAIRSLDDQIATINLYSERLHEWYGMHFPELADYARDERYAGLVARFGDRDSVMAELGIEIESIGADMGEEDLRAVMDLADTLDRLYSDEARTEAYIQGIVEECCPNMCAMLGGPLAARLVSLAGGLERLASLPSSTVQLLGAEKAMFRSMKTGKRGPKHGVLYQHPEVHRAPYWQRGKIARALAGKVLIAAKVDQYGGEFAADRLNEEFRARVAEIKKQYPDPPKKPQKQKQARQRPRKQKGAKGSGSRRRPARARATLISRRGRRGEPDSMSATDMRIAAPATGVNFRP